MMIIESKADLWPLGTIELKMLKDRKTMYEDEIFKGEGEEVRLLLCVPEYLNIKIYSLNYVLMRYSFLIECR